MIVEKLSWNDSWDDSGDNSWYDSSVNIWDYSWVEITVQMIVENFVEMIFEIKQYQYAIKKIKSQRNKFVLCVPGDNICKFIR